MNEPVLLAQGLVASDTGPALPSIDLTVRAGDICLVQVPVGQGTTALCRTLLGLQAPALGRVGLLGQDLGRLSERDLLDLRRRTAWINTVDGEGLLPAWSAYDNLALAWLQHAGKWARDPQRMRRELLDEARRYQIPLHWLDEPVARRSRPERIALSLWRAWRSRPVLAVLEGMELEQRFVGDTLDLDRLLADAWAPMPALLVFGVESPSVPPHLPAGTRIRRLSFGNHGLEESPFIPPAQAPRP